MLTQGARFDILAVVRIVAADNTAIVSTGLARCVRGLAVPTGLNEVGKGTLRNASRVVVPFAPFETPPPPGLGIREVALEVSARLGTLDNGLPCGGRTRSQGLRVYYGKFAPGAFRFVALKANVYLVNRPGLPSNLGTSVPVTPIQSADSPSLGFSNRNPWKDVGTWSGARDLGHTEVARVSPLRLWVGLKNGDDVGTRFDLRAILRVTAGGESREVEGIARCVSGAERNPALAKEVSILFSEFEELYLSGTATTLQIEELRISARIGTATDDTFCGGHSSAQGLRLYFGSADRPAGFSFVLEDSDDY
jgi:hypothetical protein